MCNTVLVDMKKWIKFFRMSCFLSQREKEINWFFRRNAFDGNVKKKKYQPYFFHPVS